MPTKVEFQTYSGGDGSGDPCHLIGIVKESPIEVLKTVYMTHSIYFYRDLYRPVDYSFPNNVEGLKITETDEHPSMTIDEMLEKSKGALTRNARNEKVYTEAIEAARKWNISNLEENVQKTNLYSFEDIAQWKATIHKRHIQLDEVAHMTLGKPIPQRDVPEATQENWEHEAKVWKQRCEVLQKSRNEAWEERDRMREQLRIIKDWANPYMPKETFENKKTK
ncbi:hypothetical protein [Brevibacillus brevis]|uniref:hypothetical protein n=1 Tax=Brevibacillus brevis TaxID=1393 RepID=UPI0007D8C8BA|nr:hypothetical protein [Brevibacillus brevis]